MEQLTSQLKINANLSSLEKVVSWHTYPRILSKNRVDLEQNQRE